MAYLGINHFFTWDPRNFPTATKLPWVVSMIPWNKIWHRYGPMRMSRTPPPPGKRHCSCWTMPFCRLKINKCTQYLLINERERISKQLVNNNIIILIQQMFNNTMTHPTYCTIQQQNARGKYNNNYCAYAAGKSYRHHSSHTHYERLYSIRYLKLSVVIFYSKPVLFDQWFRYNVLTRFLYHVMASTGDVSYR